MKAFIISDDLFRNVAKWNRRYDVNPCTPKKKKKFWYFFYD